MVLCSKSLLNYLPYLGYIYSQNRKPHDINYRSTYSSFSAVYAYGSESTSRSCRHAGWMDAVTLARCTNILRPVWNVLSYISLKIHNGHLCHSPGGVFSSASSAGVHLSHGLSSGDRGACGHPNSRCNTLELSVLLQGATKWVSSGFLCLKLAALPDYVMEEKILRRLCPEGTNSPCL